MLHKDGFELRDFLEALNTFLKDFADGFNDFRSWGGESGDQLIGLRKQVENVEGLNVLVLLELGGEPLLSSDHLGDVVTSGQKVGGLLILI